MDNIYYPCFPGNYDPFVLHFEKEVLDLRQGRLRSCDTDIKNSFLSTNYNFIFYEDDSKEIKRLNKFLQEVIPSSIARNCFIQEIALSLKGKKHTTYINIHGDNFSLISLLEKTFGDYLNFILTTSNVGENNYIGSRILMIESSITKLDQEYIQSLQHGMFKLITYQNIPVQQENTIYIKCENPKKEYNLEKLKSVFMFMLWKKYIELSMNKNNIPEELYEC